MIFQRTNHKKFMVINNLQTQFRLFVAIVHGRVFLYLYSLESVLFNIMIFTHWPTLRSDPVIFRYVDTLYNMCQTYFPDKEKYVWQYWYFLPDLNNFLFLLQLSQDINFKEDTHQTTVTDVMCSPNRMTRYTEKTIFSFLFSLNGI